MNRLFSGVMVALAVILFIPRATAGNSHRRYQYRRQD
jgi:hypothetical protein